jgi:DNA-binding transcriptional MerR regulator
MDDRNSPLSNKNQKSDTKNQEPHLTISEMAERFGVTYRALRFYQQKGLLSPTRKGTTRLYRARDVAHMKIIMEAKRTGLALADVQEILSVYHKDGAERQNMIVIEKLQNQEKLLEDQYNQIGAQLKETRSFLVERLKK